MKKINLISIFVFIFLFVSCNNDEKDEDVLKAIKIKFAKTSFNLGEKIYFQFVNETDSVAYFQQCSGETDVYKELYKKNGESWAVYSQPACPTMYGPFGLKFDPSEIIYDSISFNVADTFRIYTYYKWYGKTKEMFSEDIIIH